MTNDIEVFLTTFLNKMNDSKIDFCVLRNYDTLPKKVGNDVDIFIRRNQIKTVEKILLESAKKYSWKLVNHENRYGLKSFIFIMV